MPSPMKLEPEPQDSRYDNPNYPHSQVESLEQALRIQINKRIEAETSSKKCIEIQNNLEDLHELANGFISELDGLDGDETEQHMDRKDVLWILTEVNLRVKAAHTALMTCLQWATNADNGAKVHEETTMAVLQGQIAQLNEENERLKKNNAGANGHKLTTPTNAKAATPTPITTANNGKIHAELLGQHQVLQEKYRSLEQRHGNVVREMQESLNSKNQEISKLKHEVEQKATSEVPHSAKNSNANGINCIPPPQAPATSSADGHRLDQHNPPQMSPKSPLSPFLLAPHKDLQIAALQEDIEDRNAVIAELKAELDTYIANTNVQTMAADKVKIKYLENIIHDLERKLKNMEGASRAVGNTPIRSSIGSDYKRVPSPKIAKYGSIGWGWGGSCSSLVDENLALAPGAVSSSIMEDMELKIAELTARLKDSEDELNALKRKD